MREATIPANEPVRLNVLRSYEVLDTQPEHRFDVLTELAARMFQTPMAMICFIDAERLWIKSHHGLSVRQSPRNLSFCGHVVANDRPVVVSDAFHDIRFRDNPSVICDPHVRAYAGMPLRTPEGFVLGTFSIMDRKPRNFTADDRHALALLAEQVMELLELQRRHAQSQRDLVADKARLRAIIDTAVDAIITLDEAGQIERANPAVEMLFGYSPMELVGHDVRILMPWPETKELDEYLTKYWCTGQRNVTGGNREVSGRRKDGTHFFADLSVSEMFINGKRLFTGILRDASERKRATEVLGKKNEELESQTARLNAVINTVVDGIITIDGKGIIQSFNPAAERIFGYEASEAVGRHISMLTPSTNRLRPASRIYRYFTSNQHPIADIGREVTGLRRDGTEFPLELAVSHMSIAGERMYCGITRDITHRKLVERELNQFKTTFDRTKDSILIFEPTTLRILYANQGAANHLGYSLAELLTMTPLDLAPQFSDEVYRKLLAPLIAGDQSVTTFESTYRHKNGTVLPVEILLQYMAAGDETPRFINIARDTSERMRIDKMKNEFISIVSHELRTPLTSIRGALALVSHGITGTLPPQAKEYVDIALSNSERLVRLINDILDIEKIQSGSMDYRLHPLDLGAVISKAMASNEAFASSHQVTLRLAEPAITVEVFADEDLVIQVLTNLISNAAKFSPPGQSVELALSLDGLYVRVSVRDHGPGIAEEFRSRIFQRFAQADSSDSRVKGGTGLGLSISKALVEGMRGVIGFECPADGGALFYFELPWLSWEENAKRDTEAHSARVLLCGIAPEVSPIAQVLQHARQPVHVAGSLVRARELLATCGYELVAIDATFDPRETSALLTDIAEMRETRPIPVLLLYDGGTDPIERIGRAAAGATKLIAKPLVPATLRQAIRDLCFGSSLGRRRLLHVEDDEDLRRVVRRLLPQDWQVVGADSVAQAMAMHETSAFDLVLLDLSLPDDGGETLVDVIGGEKIIVFSAKEPPPALAERVSRILVKSRTSEFEIRDAVLTAMSAMRAEKETPR